MITIHTIGDSHSYAGWQDIRRDDMQIWIHHLGAVTCSSFGIKKFELYNIQEANIKEGEVVCFVFGEIDCRTHLHKHIEMYQLLIDRIIENYFSAIKLNVDQYKNLTVLVQSVTPPARKDTYLTDHIREIEIQYGTPTLGEDSERKIFAQYMNEKIKEYCEIYNYSYLNTYDKYCDAEGYLNPELSDGNVHIKDTKKLEDEIIHTLLLR